MHDSIAEAPAPRRGGLRRFSLAGRWSAGELVTIGVFAAVSKASSLLIAFLGGGMNPLTLMAKNCLFAMLMIVLLRKVPKMGTLTLVTLVTALVSILLMGQGILHTPGAVFTCVLAEASAKALGGYGRMRNILLAVFIYEIGAKALGILLAWISMREQPGLVIPIIVFVCIGSIGTVIGLFYGARFSKELQRAGIISHT